MYKPNRNLNLYGWIKPASPLYLCYDILKNAQIYLKHPKTLCSTFFEFPVKFRPSPVLYQTFSITQCIDLKTCMFCHFPLFRFGKHRIWPTNYQNVCIMKKKQKGFWKIESWSRNWVYIDSEWYRSGESVSVTKEHDGEAVTRQIRRD